MIAEEQWIILDALAETRVFYVTTKYANLVSNEGKTGNDGGKANHSHEKLWVGSANTVVQL
jgi:hypothetical protein